jgi:hypothetical protein
MLLPIVCTLSMEPTVLDPDGNGIEISELPVHQPPYAPSWTETFCPSEQPVKAPANGHECV